LTFFEEQAMAKPKTDVPTMGEVMTGIDMVGTILDIELPKLSDQLKSIQNSLHTRTQPEGPGKKIELAELAESIHDLRDMIESQERQIAALHTRLARLSDSS